MLDYNPITFQPTPEDRDLLRMLALLIKAKNYQEVIRYAIHKAAGHSTQSPEEWIRLTKTRSIK